MSKPSPAQVDANRRNAQHARGPNTARGKANSSHNALRHGLTGRMVVLPSEDMEAYKAFSKELVDSLSPESPMERQLAQTVADTQWRLNRARSFEDGMLALGSFEDEGSFDARSPELRSVLTAAKVFQEHSKDFVNLSLYEQRLNRAHKEAFRQLRELQAERKAAQPVVPKPLPADMRASAASASAAQTTPVSAITSEPIGFVYSGTEHRLALAKTAARFSGPGHETKAA